MSLNVSDLSGDISQSEIRNMSIECDRLGGINMSQGICDLDLPLPVKLGAECAMANGINHYTRYDGLLELREAISKKMDTFNKIKTNPDTDIVVSCGATGAFYSACLALLNRGDEVILFQPFYGYHVSTLKAAGAIPVYANLSPPSWSVDLEELEKLITSRTKAIILCTPGNPSGKVFSRDELNLIAEFAIKNNLFVFTDEIYEYFIYDGMHHISPGSLESISDRTITISGYSKTFSITGWRIGYAVCHEKWARMIGYINDLIYVCGPAPLQIGVAKGINELPNDYYKFLCDEYFIKRQKVCEALSKVGIKPYVPQGAYYILADVSSLPGNDSKSKAMFLLNEIGIATVPGSAFYANRNGENLVRFCFAKDNQILDRACEQILSLKY
jgi:aminotransferase